MLQCPTRNAAIPKSPGLHTQSASGLELASLLGYDVEKVPVLHDPGHAGLPVLDLLQSISENAATAPAWSMREPSFYPAWVDKDEDCPPLLN